MNSTHDFRVCDMLVDDLRQEIERLRQANTKLCADIVRERHLKERAAELLTRHIIVAPAGYDQDVKEWLRDAMEK